MSIPVSSNNRTKPASRAPSAVENEKIETAAPPSETSEASDSSDGDEPSSTETTSRPTRETAKHARTVRAADPSLSLIRHGLERKIDEGDSPDTVQSAQPLRSPNSRRFQVLDPGEVDPKATGGFVREEGFVQRRDGSYQFNGTAADDTYEVRREMDGTFVVENQDSGDQFTLTSAEARNGVSISTHEGDDEVTVDASVWTDLRINGGVGDDRLDGSAARGELTLQGAGGDDTLIGGRRMDSLDGGSGDDLLMGGLGNDQLIGQAGNDRLLGGAGDDFVQGGAGRDALDGGLGSDAIYADSDDIRIDAGSIPVPDGSLVSDGSVDTIVTEEGGPGAWGVGTEDVSVTYSL